MSEPGADRSGGEPRPAADTTRDRHRPTSIAQTAFADVVGVALASDRMTTPSMPASIDAERCPPPGEPCGRGLGEGAEERCDRDRPHRSRSTRRERLVRARWARRRWASSMSSSATSAPAFRPRRSSSRRVPRHRSTSRPGRAGRPRSHCRAGASMPGGRVVRPDCLDVDGFSTRLGLERTRGLVRWLRAMGRTIRAMVSHSRAPIAANSRYTFRPKITISRITNRMYGSAYSTSTKRIIDRVRAPADVARHRSEGRRR